MKRSIAIVSGKGGSGKTMISAVMGLILNQDQKRSPSEFEPAKVDPRYKVVIIDSDTRTAGLSYYLGLKYLESFTGGLSQMAAARDSNSSIPQNPWDVVQRLRRELGGAGFFGVGNQRLLSKQFDSAGRAKLISMSLKNLLIFEGWKIIDCRGGIDEESIAVCEMVDDIILVVEPDVTAFQASQNVVDVLADHGLAHKLKGFIINKAFDDPSVVARSGISAMRCQCLGAVPFDSSAMRSFYVGDIPDITSRFTTQVWDALKRAYSGEVATPQRRPWDFSEFAQTFLSNTDSSFGGSIATFILLIIAGIYVILRIAGMLNTIREEIVLSIFFYVALIGITEPGRRLLGRGIRTYLRILRPHPRDVT